VLPWGIDNPIYQTVPQNISIAKKHDLNNCSTPEINTQSLAANHFNYVFIYRNNKSDIAK
jgi:hypothetical protein